MAEDFYKVLGVDKKATKADIKKAYRKKAQEHHPDKGGKETEFKKVNEAYETLSDDNKRSQYDQFGSAGSQFGGAGGFSGFGNGGFSSADFGGMEDVFSSFFGGGGRSGKKSTRGGDLEVELDITFAESVEGAKKVFHSSHFQSCDNCSAKGGEGKKKCDQCNGTGRVTQRMQTPFGAIAQQTACPTCGGEGQSFDKICSHCHGEGRVEKKTKIEIVIPSGVENGTTLRMTGKGEAGRKGGTAGDLYVHIRVGESSKFERHGLDLYSSLKISVFDALLGGKFKVETFWGKVELKVPENTKDMQLLRIKGKGIQSNGKVGDHIVRIEYEMPKKITSKMREALEQLKKH
jgi:molecular chaperone DnaJ